METQRQMIQSYRRDSFLSANYQLIQLLGSGCFGKIFKAINKKTRKLVALKIQFQKKTNSKLSINNEIKVLQLIKGKDGIPATYDYGNWPRGAYMELEILHQSLKQSRVYSPAEIIEFTLEFLNIFQTIHSYNVIHHDLKPQNLMRSKDGKLYLIDFGLARILPKNRLGTHRVGGFMGTPRYASIQAHRNLQQSKKDDLESAFYNIAYLYYQRLPWSKLKVPSEVKLQKIQLLKIRHNKTLFNQMPTQFQTAFEYICSLEDYAQPNYTYLKGIFKRHRSLVIIHPSQKQQNNQERSKVKKVSLNMSNFLQVPEVVYQQRKLLQKDQIIEKVEDLNDQQSYSYNQSFDSNRSLNYSLKGSQRSITEICEADNGDFGQQQNIQPQIPKSFIIGQNIMMKNPFAMAEYHN